MRFQHPLAGGLTALLLAVAALLGTATGAAAHVQVAPAVVAPNDPVKFTVLVPGERAQRTVRVAVKMPAGLLPFSYEATPGWRRRLVKAPNGAVDQIVWSGRLAVDGFAEFSFLAGTPPHPGVLAFKALQTYSDGTVVRWIGPPGSDQPAPVVRVVAGAPRQNAGGEGAKAGGGAEPPAGTTASPPAAAADAGGADWVARGLALAALAALLALVLLRRRRGQGADVRP